MLVVCLLFYQKKCSFFPKNGGLLVKKCCIHKFFCFFSTIHTITIYLWFISGGGLFRWQNQIWAGFRFVGSYQICVRPHHSQKKPSILYVWWAARPRMVCKCHMCVLRYNPNKITGGKFLEGIVIYRHDFLLFISHCVFLTALWTKAKRSFQAQSKATDVVCGSHIKKRNEKQPENKCRTPW